MHFAVNAFRKIRALFCCFSSNMSTYLSYTLSLLSITLLHYQFRTVHNANQWISYPLQSNIQYIYVTQCRSWDESQKNCNNLGGELASPSTQSMRNFLVNTVYDGTSNSGSCTSWDGSYVGGITDQISTINWFDGTSTDFYNATNPIDWDTKENEPDNLSTHTVMGFKLSSRQWHTVYPGDKNVQFCQRIITNTPTKIAPTTNSPTTNSPTTNSPTTIVITTATPTTFNPTTNSPTTYAPSTNSPTTNAPATNSPTTNSPTTNSPTTIVITTATPTTFNPTTNSPTTYAPSTNSPTTNAPAHLLHIHLLHMHLVH
eukprot:340955_1